MNISKTLNDPEAGVRLTADVMRDECCNQIADEKKLVLEGELMPNESTLHREVRELLERVA